ncbi:MAG: hypothetical protein KDJ80_05815 [Nitratireductor sp.]|nr:hypothetical protein [Nitratireductor sp.]
MSETGAPADCLAKAVPRRWVFVCGAHMDQALRLDAPARLGVSNPAKVENLAGGSALNAAGVAAAIGLDLTLLSPIGADAGGAILHETCAARGIGDRLIEMPGHATGLYSVLIEPDGNVLIGASDLALYETIDTAWLKTHLRPLMDGGTGLFLNANLSGAALEAAVAMADFVAAATISPAKAARLSPVLAGIDLLFANLAEARALAGEETATAEAAAAMLMERGVGAGAVTHEADPVTGWSEGRIRTTKPPRVDRIADSNGAGDAFAGGVLAALAGGRGFAAALDTGIAAAGLCLRAEGPYPDRAALASLMNPTGTRS